MGISQSSIFNPPRPVLLQYLGEDFCAMVDVIILIEASAGEAVTVPIGETLGIDAFDVLLQRLVLEGDVGYRQLHVVDDMLEVAEVTLDDKALVGGYAVDGYPMALLAEGLIRCPVATVIDHLQHTLAKDIDSLLRWIQ